VTEAEHIHAATSWITSLVALCGVSGNAAPSRDALATYGTLLARTFHPDAFCLASLDEVSTGLHGTPSLDEVRKRLGAWWRGQQARTRALPAPPDPRRVKLTDMERLWLQRWRHHEATSFAEVNPPVGVTARNHMLSLLKARAHGAWLLVAGEEDDTASVMADWQNPANVAAAVRSVLAPMPGGSDPPAGNIKLCLALLRGLVGKHAPENLYLIPGEARPPPGDPRADRPPPPPPRPSKPVPEELQAAARDRNPIVQAARAMRDQMARERQAAAAASPQPPAEEAPDDGDRDPPG
jgi:hypothetical protein